MAKIRFAQSDFSLCPNTAARKSRGKTVVQTNSKHYHELMSGVLPVNTSFQKISKSGFFLTQLEAIQEHLSS